MPGRQHKSNTPLHARLQSDARPSPIAAGVPPPAIALSRMTKREAEVLGWLAHGLSNAEIAVVLHLRVRTIHKHMACLVAKLGVESRTAAVAIACELKRFASRGDKKCFW